MKEGIVLFAHGSRDPQWARPFEQLAATLSKKFSGPVRLAYLEFMSPTIDDAIAALVGEGIASIRVVPVFLGKGGHVNDDLPKLAANVRRKYPNVTIEVEQAIGEQPAVIDAIAAAIATKKSSRS